MRNSFFRKKRTGRGNTSQVTKPLPTKTELSQFIDENSNVRNTGEVTFFWKGKNHRLPFYGSEQSTPEILQKFLDASGYKGATNIKLKI